ncbi:hypothetical protein [Rhodopirellula bahusiensis]|uniref:hypothetical protein n=1 Tax=Rhodopirellula bahusiensis TaxID=2014065 RepID=UPI0032630170
MALATKTYHGQTQHAPTTPKPTLSSRFAKLIGKVGESQATEDAQRIESLDGLIDALADAEVNPEAKQPTAANVRSVCDAVGYSLDQLESDVARKVEFLKSREVLAGESEVIQEIADIKEAIKQHAADVQSMIADMQSKGDQLQAELREAEDRRRTIESHRSIAAAAAGGPSKREQEIQEQIRKLVRQESDIRIQAGRSALPDRFVGASIEDSKTFKELAQVNSQIEALEGKDTHGGSREAFALRKLYPKRTELQRDLANEKRLYTLGNRVAEVRQQIDELNKERDQLAAERLKQLTNV